VPVKLQGTLHGNTALISDTDYLAAIRLWHEVPASFLFFLNLNFVAFVMAKFLQHSLTHEDGRSRQS
jgi:hypothetical protein